MPIGGVMSQRAIAARQRVCGVWMEVVIALPIADAAVAIKHALRQFLLKRMFLHLGFIDRNAEARPVVRADDAALLFYGEALIDNVLPPGNVGVDRFANDVTWLREA